MKARWHAAALLVAGLIPPSPAPARGQEAAPPPPPGRFADLAPAPLSDLLVETPHERADRLVAEARAHREANRWRAALEATGQAIAADPDRAEAYILRSKLYGGRRLFAHAIAALDDAIAALPENPSLRALRGSYRCLQRDAGGLAEYDDALRLARGRPSVVLYIRRERGRSLAELGDDRRCVAEFDALITPDDKVMTDYFWRGTALLHLGEFERALPDFERAAALEPDPNDAYWRGYARLRAGRYAEALADYESARLAYPNSEHVQAEYGLALLAVGRKAEAIRHLDALLARFPADGRVQTTRGWVALLTGDMARAHDLLARATDQPNGQLFAGFGGGWLLKTPQADAILADFEARCRTAPDLPFALYYRAGDEAKTNLVPHPEFDLALVCRFLRDSRLAPLLIFQVQASYPDQPWRPAAHLGRVLAASGQLDPRKIQDAAEDLCCGWLWPEPLPRPALLGRN